MVHRDPETGQFVADDDDRGITDISGTEVFSGRMSTDISAADLTNGEDSELVTGEAAEVIDFSGVLSSDEVFVAHKIEVTASFRPERTATAEHQYEVSWLARRNSEFVPLIQDSQQSGTATVQTGQSDEDDVMVAGSMSGTGDFADSATGLAGGADLNHQVRTMNYPEADLPAPGFDQDDELYLPHSFVVLGSDDQGAGVTFFVTMYGQTYDL